MFAEEIVFVVNSNCNGGALIRSVFSQGASVFVVNSNCNGGALIRSVFSQGASVFVVNSNCHGGALIRSIFSQGASVFVVNSNCHGGALIRSIFSQGASGWWDFASFFYFIPACIAHLSKSLAWNGLRAVKIDMSHVVPPCEKLTDIFLFAPHWHGQRVSHVVLPSQNWLTFFSVLFSPLNHLDKVSNILLPNENWLLTFFSVLFFPFTHLDKESHALHWTVKLTDNFFQSLCPSLAWTKSITHRIIA